MLLILSPIKKRSGQAPEEDFFAFVQAAEL